MCGIIGYAGSSNISNSVLINGLHALEYRGYDSAGIAVLNKDKIQIIKAEGNVSQLSSKVAAMQLAEGTIGIGHTRWATHGKPSEDNAHPHQCGNVTLVHNGIIENYHEIREELKSKGYHFYSETDSEVAAAYINFCYQNSNDKFSALAQAYRHFQGSFAFAIIFHDELDTLYAMRKNSPLVLGIADNQTFLSSDISAFLTYTDMYMVLEHEEIARCTKQGINLQTLDGEHIHREPKITTMKANDIQKNGFEHYMLKEIHEEPEVIRQTIASFLQDNISELTQTMPDVSKYDNIHIVACGSAMYAGMIAKSLIETKARIQVNCVCASEYRYANPIFTKNTLAIFISQSGETADTIAALQLAKQQNIDTLAIVNVPGSTIARDADYVLFTKAGAEISVATTKAYCAQVAVLSLLACKLAYSHDYITGDECSQLEDELKILPDQMKSMIQKDYLSFAKKIYEHEDVFFIGRGIDYSLSMEGSLKLKEISYIHSEAYAAGELKHGTISLIEAGTPVIALATDEQLYEKTISNIKEVKARGAYVLLIVREDLQVSDDVYDDILYIPKADIFLQGLLTVIPLQLLAYQIAKLRGCEIDQPRNLAKSVTVE
ncbi:glutamine--fructose-6-phosphate transaminase (isomerizing) [Erysipelotrichaceae bacterium HCN-30851]